MQQMRQIEWKKYLSLLLCVHVRNFAANHHTPGNFHAPNCSHPIHSSSISGGRTTEIWLISFVITRQIVRYWIMNHSISSSTSFLSKIFWTSKISILVDFEDSDVWLCTFLLFLFFIVLHDAIWWQHCVLYWHNLTLPTSLIAVHNMPGDVFHSRMHYSQLWARAPHWVHLPIYEPTRGGAKRTRRIFRRACCPVC